MTKKLTLNIDETLIGKAKAYALRTGRSLPRLVENYINNLVEQDEYDKSIKDKIATLAGKIQLPIEFDGKKILKKYFEEKHL